MWDTRRNLLVAIMRHELQYSQLQYQYELEELGPLQKKTLYCTSRNFIVDSTSSRERALELLLYV